MLSRLLAVEASRTLLTPFGKAARRYCSRPPPAHRVRHPLRPTTSYVRYIERHPISDVYLVRLSDNFVARVRRIHSVLVTMQNRCRCMTLLIACSAFVSRLPDWETPHHVTYPRPGQSASQTIQTHTKRPPYRELCCLVLDAFGGRPCSCA